MCLFIQRKKYKENDLEAHPRLSMLEEKPRSLCPTLSFYRRENSEWRGERDEPRSERKYVADAKLNPGIWTPSSVLQHNHLDGDGS